VAEIAECNHVLRNVGTALRTRDNMVGMKYAVRITASVAADLALLAVPALDESAESSPIIS
jgi:hypothetical protein